MLFKSRRYSLCKDVVLLPTRDERGRLHSFVNRDMMYYTYFGRICEDRNGSIKVRHQCENGEDYVYAKPMQVVYFLMMNLALCDDNHFYLAVDGKVYRAKKSKKLKVY